MLRVLLVSLATAAACTSIAGLDGDYVLGAGGEATTAQASGTSAGGAPAEGGAASTGGSPAAGGSGGVAEGLDDTDLFARYWVDEGASGAATGNLNDAAPNPQPLTLTQLAGTSMNWIEPAPGQRALEWDNNTNGGQASVALSNTKFTQLWGRTNVTVEAVVTCRGNPSWHGRLFHLGDDSTASSLQLSRVYGVLYLYVNDLGYTQWSLPPLDERVVLHLVLDTTLDTDNRARLFQNGTLLSPVGGIAPPANEAIAEEPDPLPDYFVIGNTDGATRSWDGAIHYLAIYTTTFTPERVAEHAALLSTADDAQ